MPTEHRCPQCNQQFAHKSKLIRHEETHMITGDWLCGLCDILFARFPALTLHWRKVCPEMKHVFSQDQLKIMPAEDLQEAAFRHTLERYSQESAQSDEAPVDVEPSCLVVCVYCSIHLPRGVLQNHYKVHVNQKMAGELIRNSPVPYICDVCGFGFRFKKSLIQHWRTKCSETLAHVAAGTTVMSNENLRILVEAVVKRAERHVPVAPFVGSEEGNEQKRAKTEEMDEEEEREEDLDEETSAAFTGPINRPDSANYKEKWAVDEEIREKIHQCEHCSLGFMSSGRKLRHESMMHSDPKPTISCELCKTKFKQSRVLWSHLRDHCKAMKVEVPDEKKRKKMTREELGEVIEKTKGRWNGLYERKKRQNLMFIEQFLNGIDRKRQGRSNDAPLIVPMTPSFMSDDSESGRYTCEICKAVFLSDRIIQLHIQTVHEVDRQPRNQLTITATSLLPYLKLDPANFFDSQGEEYKIGKVLDKDNDLARHLRDKRLEHGSRVKNIEGDCFLVELIDHINDNDKNLIVLNRRELERCCGVDGRLKKLYAQNPMIFNDWPVLQRQC